MPTMVVVPDPLATALRAHRLIFFRRVGPRAALLLCVIWLVVLALLWMAPGGALARLALALALFATLLPPVVYLSGRRLLRKSFRAIPGGAYTYAIDEEGIGWSSPIGTSQVRWPGFTRVMQFRALWVLLIAERQFIALPTEQLDAPSRTLILDRGAGAKK